MPQLRIDCRQQIGGENAGIGDQPPVEQGTTTVLLSSQDDDWRNILIITLVFPRSGLAHYSVNDPGPAATDSDGLVGKCRRSHHPEALK